MSKFNCFRSNYKKYTIVQNRRREYDLIKYCQNISSFVLYVPISDKKGKDIFTRCEGVAAHHCFPGLIKKKIIPKFLLLSKVYLNVSLIVIHSEMSSALSKSAKYIIILVSPLLDSGFLLTAYLSKRKRLGDRGPSVLFPLVMEIKPICSPKFSSLQDIILSLISSSYHSVPGTDSLLVVLSQVAMSRSSTR